LNIISIRIKSYKYFLYSLFYFARKNKQLAKNYYLLSLTNQGTRNFSLENKLDNFYSKKDKKIKIAVSGWELSHNAAGRAITLAELYHYAGFNDVEMIGSIINSKSKQARKIWQPLLSHHIPVNYFSIGRNDIDAIVSKTMEFVVQNPYDIVHLSKPRITNIVIGLMYKLIWGSTVIIDIDDEELAFGTSNINHLKGTDDSLKENIRDVFWTKKAIQLIENFDLVSVSNPALQKKYGGFIIPHVRNENIFVPSDNRKNSIRKKFNIPVDKIVVIFFGTPKRHKGIIETAKVLAALNDDRILYTIVGDFQDKSLKHELESISGINICFLPNQRFDEAADIVSMGDICILLQEKNNDISKYQLPAKLVDALGMGLKIFIQKTEATANLSEGSQIEFVDLDNLEYCLKNYLENEHGKGNEILSQREYFLENFSMSSAVDDINYIIKNYEDKNNMSGVNYENITYYSKLNLFSLIKKCRF